MAKKKVITTIQFHLNAALEAPNKVEYYKHIVFVKYLLYMFPDTNVEIDGEKLFNDFSKEVK